MPQRPEHTTRSDWAKPDPAAPRRDLAAAEASDAADADLLDARANAMLPAQLIQPGEVIILLIKPSPWFILLVPLRFIAIVVLVATLISQLAGRGIDLGIDRNDLIVGVLGLVGLRLFWQLLEWLSHVYVLTDQRVIRIQGVLNVQVFECPLQKVQQTDLILPLIQRIFWLGTIGFATAGTAVHEAFWFMIARPLDVHAKVIETMRRYRR